MTVCVCTEKNKQRADTVTAFAHGGYARVKFLNDA